MGNVLREEFRLKNVWFGHDKPEAFYKVQWRWHPAFYITYRVIVACYSVAFLVAIEIKQGTIDSLAYLTIWTYTLLCMYQVTALLSSIYGIVSRRKRQEPSGNSTLVKAKTIENNAFEAAQNLGYMEENINCKIANGNASKIVYNQNSDRNNTEDKESSISSTTNLNNPRINGTCWFMKLTWCLADMVYVFGIVVTVVYFTALFPSIGVTSFFIYDLNVHAFNTVQILIDIALVARPMRLLHVIYPLLYGVIYVIFSLIYWSQDKVNNVLYPNILDWNHPGTTILFMLLLAVVALPLLQLTLFGLYRLRLYVYKRIYGRDYNA